MTAACTAAAAGQYLRVVLQDLAIDQLPHLRRPRIALKGRVDQQPIALLAKSPQPRRVNKPDR